MGGGRKLNNFFKYWECSWKFFNSWNSSDHETVNLWSVK